MHYPVPGTARRKIDIAFPKSRLAVFIDGCFWHACPQHGITPKSNSDWWSWKLSENTTRDADTNERLTAAGWSVMRFWEHEAPRDVAAQIEDAIRGPSTPAGESKQALGDR